MTPKLALYSRKDCCLCDEMKEVIRQVSEKVSMDLEEIDVDSSAQLKETYGDEVPVLFVDGRKAFKYRVTVKELEERLGRHRIWTRWGLTKRGA
jgi:glutaredoxin